MKERRRLEMWFWLDGIIVREEYHGYSNFSFLFFKLLNILNFFNCTYLIIYICICTFVMNTQLREGGKKLQKWFKANGIFVEEKLKSFRREVT